MPRRIEIELTSARPDGTWTWRAAGAREPKGVLDGSLLHSDAKPGEVLKAEAEFELEGIVIISVAAPRRDNRPEAQRIEIVGPGRPEGPGVTTQLVGRGERRSGDRRRDRDDGDRRGDRGPGRPQGGRPRTEGETGRRDGGPGSGRPGRGDRPGRPDAGREGGRREGPRREGPGREGASREGAGREGGGREGRRPADAEGRSGGDRRPGGATRTSSQAERSRAPRLNPGSAHRRAVMDGLPPEQQAIAEQLLRGGIPAVRTALHLEREKAEAEGRPAPNSEELLALAETLLPRLRAAEWRDRAEAAVAAVDSISMRDLRSVVAGADVARDDETRALGATLREALDRRVQKLHQDWAAEIVAHLDAGKTIRAVRLSGRAPDPSARLEPELATRLTEAASATMSPETPSDLWASLLEAVAESPIRRSVNPTGLPADAPPELKRAAHQYSGSIPALAKLLGIAIPPPPLPVGPRKRPEGGDAPARRSRPAGGGRRPGGTPDATGAAAAPAPEAPAPEAATPEAHAAEAPAAEAPAAEAPATDAPVTEAAAPEAPAAEAPTAETVAAEAPDGDTEAPAAETPAPETPAEEAIEGSASPIGAAAAAAEVERAPLAEESPAEPED